MTSTPTSELADLIRKMRASLAGDRDARGVFDQVLAQAGRVDAGSLLGLDPTAYDTARRRMIRTLHRQFYPGWTS